MLTLYPRSVLFLLSPESSKQRSYVHQMRLGKEIRRLRDEAGLSVRELAARVGKSPGYISRLEVRDEIPSPRLICELAMLFDSDPERLLRLAKSDQLKKSETEIEEKQSHALRLFRKHGSETDG